MDTISPDLTTPVADNVRHFNVEFFGTLYIVPFELWAELQDDYTDVSVLSREQLTYLTLREWGVVEPVSEMETVIKGLLQTKGVTYVA